MTEQHEQQPRNEQGRETRPRLYVASLADYNAGRLHGAWIDAVQEPEQLEAEIAAVLKCSPRPGAEEWAIHDYEGFGPIALSEHESLERVARIARGIAEHGLAFAAWVCICDHDDDVLDRFEDAYFGSWPNLEQYAQELLDDFSIEKSLEELPGWIQPYIKVDVEGLTRDLELGGEITSVDSPDGSVWVFDGHG
jgi:antirestriction protein